MSLTLVGLLCLLVVVCVGIWLMFRSLDSYDHEGIINVWHNHIPQYTTTAGNYLHMLDHQEANKHNLPA